MESHAPALELGEGVHVPNLALPPNIDEYVPLQVQQYGALVNNQPNTSKNSQALPRHSRVGMVISLATTCAIVS